MVDFDYKEKYDVYDFKKIIALLRGEGGCPWDREQTHESIRRNLIEETYEAVEAIDHGDAALLQGAVGGGIAVLDEAGHTEQFIHRRGLAGGKEFAVGVGPFVLGR